MKFGDIVVRNRRIIMITALILLIPSVLGMIATRINYDMLYYLPEDIETVQGQNVLLDEFGKGGFSIVVVEDMKSDDVSSMAEKISGIDHVDSVIDLQKILDPSIPRDMLPDIVNDSISNPDASMIVVFFDSSTSSEETLNAVSDIREVLNETSYISGMSSLVLDLKNLCEREEAKYVAVAVIMALAAMMLLMDSFAIPFLFLIGIGMAILYNMGSNILFGEISFITMAIAAVLQLAVTMDYSIFLWHRYIEKLDEAEKTNSEGDEKELERRAMAEAIDDTLTSVAGSSITTIAGFLALCFMTYTMGRDLGLVMAKGVVFGVLASVTILPVMILKFSGLLRRTRHRSIIPDMGRFAHFLTGRYWVYILVFAIMLVPSVIFYNQKNVVYDFTKMFSSNAESMADEDKQFMIANDKLREDFDIGTSHIIIADADLPAREGRAMCKEIENLDGIKNVLGIDALLGTSIPRSMLPDQVSEALIGDRHQMILVNSAYRVSSDECNDQIDRIDEILNRYDEGATVIGEGPATKDLIQITGRDFTTVNWISIGMVFVIILLVLKSVSLPVILVAAIEFAIILNLGICGFTGLELPFIIPVLISTIQLGSTVDYAILLSTRYKQERIGGKAKRAAVEEAARTSIPSIVVSALGFFTATVGVAVYSDIAIISTVCGLMARGAVISMFTVIFLLPSLLMASDKLICRTTAGMKESVNGHSPVNGDAATC
ncbi:MAG: MMPL family transporter [Mogibacterium sp.]|nr:MMPL family transporter [Mogibacterium sp.]